MRRESCIYYVYCDNEFIGSYNTVGEDDAVLCAMQSMHRDGNPPREESEFRADRVE